MNLRFDQNEKDIIWACQKLEIDRQYFGNCSSIALDNSMVAIYSAFNGVNCEVTIVSDTIQWLRQKYLKSLLAYPFRQLGCRRITVLVKSTNQMTIRAALKVGFTQEGVLRKFMASGEDVIILGYLKEEYEMSKYRWSDV